MSERGPEDTAPLAPPRPLGSTTESRVTARGRKRGSRPAAPAPAAQPTAPDAVQDQGRPSRPQPQQRNAAGSSVAASPEATTRETPAPGLPPLSAPGRQPAGATLGREATRPVQSASKTPQPPRRARLRLTRIDPWSVMKMAFLLSMAFGIVVVVAVAVLWSVLNAAGLWESVNSSIAGVLGDAGAKFDVQDYVGMQRVMGFTTLVACADVVLLTAIATLSAFLYNLAAALLGGLEVTLSED